MNPSEAVSLLRGGSEGVAEWNRRRLLGGWTPSLSQVDLSDALLATADLHELELAGAALARADLRGATMWIADLSHANLTEADLRGAILHGADLEGACLRRANLRGANLRRANLSQACLESAVCGETIFDSDLSKSLNLNEIVHLGPSTIGMEALYSLAESPPQQFLVGCGIPEGEIARLHAELEQPIRFYSCFISYSSRGEPFANRLYQDLTAAGVRCWKWDHDARIGRGMWTEIDQAIRLYDKLVVVASESSLTSPYVNREIERAIRQEDERGTDVLFPVRIDDYIFNHWEHARKTDVVSKVIADARQWQTMEVYGPLLERLIRDLRHAEGQPES